jgi:hypothetical protein
MDYLRGGLGTSRAVDERHELTRPLTPRSERPAVALGMLQASLQGVEGLCVKARKCVLHDGHKAPCWPGD